MKIDYLWSKDETAHAINCEMQGTSLFAGILCLVSRQSDTIRIGNEIHSFLVEVPSDFRSGRERVKVFNAALNILSHEQIQLPSADKN
jgi:hypothetical protein